MYYHSQFCAQNSGDGRLYVVARAGNLPKLETGTEQEDGWALSNFGIYIVYITTLAGFKLGLWHIYCVYIFIYIYIYIYCIYVCICVCVSISNSKNNTNPNLFFIYMYIYVYIYACVMQILVISNIEKHMKLSLQKVIGTDSCFDH